MKGLTVAFILAFVLLVLMATNPTLEDHREAVKNLALKEMGRKSSSSSNNGNEFSKLGEQLGEEIGKGMLDMMVKNLVSRDNYLVFSSTKLKYFNSNEPVTVGYGFLGKVYMLDMDEVKKTLEKDKKSSGIISKEVHDEMSTANTKDDYPPVEGYKVKGIRTFVGEYSGFSCGDLCYLEFKNKTGGIEYVAGIGQDSKGNKKYILVLNAESPNSKLNPSMKGVRFKLKVRDLEPLGNGEYEYPYTQLLEIDRVLD